MIAPAPMIALYLAALSHLGLAGKALERPPELAPPMSSALASWYSDHGTGACGVGDVQAGFRFASLFLRCGARVRFRHAGREVTATMADHGPYVSGRLFDLNANLRAALACGDLCVVQYRIGG